MKKRTTAWPRAAAVDCRAMKSGVDDMDGAAEGRGAGGGDETIATGVARRGAVRYCGREEDSVVGALRGAREMGRAGRNASILGGEVDEKQFLRQGAANNAGRQR